MLELDIESELDPQCLFYKSMNDQLNRFGIQDEGSFSDELWSFESPYSKNCITIDFALFDLPELKLGFALFIEFSGASIEVEGKTLAKVMWLNLIDNSKGVGYHNARSIETIALVFAFLAQREIDTLREPHLVKFYIFLLGNQVGVEGVDPRFTAPTYQSVIENVQIFILARILRSYGVDNLIGNISNAKTNRALDEACRSQLGMSLSDYKKGNTLNYLGLDIGRHYVDHCGNLFEEHFQYAAAVRIVLSTIVEDVEKSLNSGDERTILPAVAQILLGGTIDDACIATGNAWKKDKLASIYSITHQCFLRSYNQLSEIATVFRLDLVNEIISESNFPDRYDVQEFVRSFLFSIYVNEDVKSSSQIFREYASSLDRDGVKLSIDFVHFRDLCTAIVSRRRSILKEGRGEFKALCRRHTDRLATTLGEHGIRRLKSCITLVESSGVTLLVGLLGWRRSEYGFPLKNILIDLNHDVLDNLYSPFRFRLKWVVPKTSGDTQVDREITLYTYIIVFLLDKLNVSLGEKPALYFTSRTLEKRENLFDSASLVSRRIAVAWPDFIQNYLLFVEIEKSGNAHREGLEVEHVEALIKIRRRLLSGLPKYELCNSQLRYRSLKHILNKYVKGTLDHENTLLLDEALDEDSAVKLKAGSYQLNQGDLLYLRSQILQDVAYPTPHAFRHMWAEAVLKRYRGDVGKFIRANFKHLDESFFMSYLRDKEARAIYEVAKRTVINSIVREQLSNLTKNSRSFSGGFNRFLSRAIASTKVVSTEDMEKLATHICSDRIIDIKTNAWSTCLLRSGTESVAKCSDGDVPQRWNAEPKLCLGCVNADISEGNFNGIVVYIKMDVEACRNPKLPYFIKEPHISIVRLALKRVKQLNASNQISKYSSYIEYLEETLQMAVDHGAEEYQRGNSDE